VLPKRAQPGTLGPFPVSRFPVFPFPVSRFPFCLALGRAARASIKVLVQHT